jgi:hypothetical protein
MKLKVHPATRDSTNLLLKEIFVSIAVRTGTMKEVTGYLDHSANSVPLTGYDELYTTEQCKDVGCLNPAIQ